MDNKDSCAYKKTCAHVIYALNNQRLRYIPCYPWLVWLSMFVYCMVILGYLCWLSVVILGYIWLYMVILGYLWLSLVIYGYLWLSLGIYGYLWLSLVICGYPWVSMVISNKQQLLAPNSQGLFSVHQRFVKIT